MVATSVNTRPAIGSIVVATDFSEAAHAALERAVRLPLRLGATVEIVHVADHAVETSFTERLEGVAKQRLEALRHEARDALATERKEHDVFVTLAHGKPFVEIV